MARCGGENFVPGTAIDSLTGAAEDLPSEYWDYYVDSETVGELTIPAGETSGAIGINVFSDFIYEPTDEKIEITLNTSTGVEVGTNATMTVTVTQEDGKIVQLTWDDGVGADMDLAIWVTLPDDEGNPVDIPFALSVNASTNGLEQRIIPDVFSDGLLEDLGETTLEYGASYIYYSGNDNPLDFEVDFVGVVNKATSLIENFQATYTKDNKNEWDEQEDGIFSTVIVQTFDYNAGDLVNISDIEVPIAGSRVRSAEYKGLIKRNRIPIPLKKVN